MILIGILLFIGNMSVAQESQSSPVNSKCQAFVSSIFEHYGLPLPGTNEFPVHGDFDLENYDQEKPEFTIMTTPIEIQKQDFSMRTLEIMSQESIYKSEDHLKFEGKVLADGSYAFAVSEINPQAQTSEENPYMQTIFSIPDMETPLAHVFRFSKDCEFLSYHIHKEPTMKRTGFRVSTNSQCIFDEPVPGEGLTAHELIATGNYNYMLLNPERRYAILYYPDYYRGICTLAKNTNSI